MARYPNMSVILSHAGGYIPYQAVRICRASAPSAAYPGAAAADMVADMRRYYFDTTLSGALAIHTSSKHPQVYQTSHLRHTVAWM